MLVAVAAKPVPNALQPDTHEQAGERKAELWGSTGFFGHTHSPVSTVPIHRHAPTSTDGMHRHHPTAGKKAAALQGKPQPKAELWGSTGFFGHTHSPVPNLHRHAPTSDGMRYPGGPGGPGTRARSEREKV